MTALEGSKAATSSAGLAAYGMSATPKVSLPINSESVTSDVMASDSNGFTVAEAGGGQSQAESSLDGFTNSDGGEQEMGAEGFEGGEDIQFSVRTADAGTKSQSIEKAAATSSAFSLAPEPTEAEQAKNVREIMQQTQFLMKKGGGEAKVTLNPEGLGQIQLKVSTEGEQVAVDMVAESSEAKKLIEKGLGDLKATLASHKLNVENLKVDLASDIQKQFDHAHDEAQRQSAQQFMESFREQNGAWRQSFLDMPGVRMPGSRGAEDGLTLETLEERKKSSSSRRLDLVA
ncbi:MAG: flagellar hook-length control protein FliK [Bdellovibrionales bacterium]|nr:flagellar hook-length control protein FliK [Bdellovibrionales bacterium]